MIFESTPDEFWDGPTPPPESDGLNPPLRQVRDAYLQVQVTAGAVETARIAALNAVYSIAEQRTLATGVDRSGSEFDAAFGANLRSVLASLGALTHESEASLVARAREAYEVTTHFNEWLPILQAGRVSIAHVRAMLRHAQRLSEQQYAEYSAVVLEFAQRKTPGQTESFARRLAAKLTAATFAAEHAVERQQRRVTVQDAEFGMSWISAYVPTATAHAIDSLLHEQARELRRVPEGAAPEPRTLEQIRADLFVDTMLTATPQAVLESANAGVARVTAHVGVVVPVLALTEPDAPRDVATLNGTSPISLAEARAIAADTPSLQRILTDPVDGHVITVDQRVPTASLRRFLRARDVNCRFPGCRTPAHRAELDHTVPWSEGGESSPENLAHLCSRHHVQKHRKPWRMRNLGEGVIEWISPLGDVVRSEPEPPGPVFRPRAVDPAPF